MRVLVVARDQLTGERTRAINALTALVRTVDLGVDARKSLSIRQITTMPGWRERDEDVIVATCRAETMRLARRVRNLDVDVTTNRAGITELKADPHRRREALRSGSGAAASLPGAVLGARRISRAGAVARSRPPARTRCSPSRPHRQ